MFDRIENNSSQRSVVFPTDEASNHDKAKHVRTRKTTNEALQISHSLHTYILDLSLFPISAKPTSSISMLTTNNERVSFRRNETNNSPYQLCQHPISSQPIPSSRLSTETPSRPHTRPSSLPLQHDQPPDTPQPSERLAAHS